MAMDRQKTDENWNIEKKKFKKRKYHRLCSMFPLLKTTLGLMVRIASCVSASQSQPPLWAFHDEALNDTEMSQLRVSPSRWRQELLFMGMQIGCQEDAHECWRAPSWVHFLFVGTYSCVVYTMPVDQIFGGFMHQETTCLQRTMCSLYSSIPFRITLKLLWINRIFHPNAIAMRQTL